MDKIKDSSGISVIIPTLHRSSVLASTLNDLANQDFENFEIIVVDQSDRPDKEAQKLLEKITTPSSYFHTTEFRGLPEARNFGLSKASHEIVLYIDDDIRCGTDFVRRHLEAHLYSDATMIAGGIREAKGERDEPGATGSFNWWTATPRRNFHLTTPGWCTHAPGGNFSVRREALKEIGGFDENLTVGAALYEETELGLRLRAAGFRCWFAPEAHLVHLAAPMGGCRVGPDVPRYVFGMAHNRAIVIFRHLKVRHRFSAVLRMVAYGLSYGLSAKSFRPIVSSLRGLVAGRRAAGRLKSNLLHGK